jgi:ArsR family transcriptional regulator
MTVKQGPIAGQALAPSAADRRQARYRAHAEICKVLTDPKRLMLIDLLRRGARSVGMLAEEAGLSLANTSQHLAVLRHAGLVDTRRAGTTIHYRLSQLELTEACDLIDRIVDRRLGSELPEA